MRERRTRRDVARNRAALVRAARAAIAAGGLGFPLADVARRAGLGTATLYRHFPSRDDLLAAVFAADVEHCTELLGRAVEDPDVWRGFSTAVREVVDLELENPGFLQVAMADRAAVTAFRGFREAAAAQLEALVRRLTADGVARPDLTASDVVLLVQAARGAAGTGTSARPRAERMLDLVLLGVAARGHGD